MRQALRRPAGGELLQPLLGHFREEFEPPAHPHEAGNQALAQTFASCLDEIALALGLHVPPSARQVRVFGPDPAPVLEACEASGLFNESSLDEIRRHVLGYESYFLPQLGAVFLATPDPAEIGEEAAHLLRHACGGTPPAVSRADLFYQSTLHEALGYFGSKLIGPTRRTASEDEIVALSGRAPLLYRGAFRAAAAHILAERQPAQAGHIRRIYRASIPVFVGAAHLLGYSLGERLYRAFAREEIGPGTIRTYFREDWAPPGAALSRYLLLRGRFAEDPEAASN